MKILKISKTRLGYSTYSSDNRKIRMLSFHQHALTILCNRFEKFLLSFDFNDFSTNMMYMESRIYADVNTMAFYRYYGYLHEKD